jgi:hypothetical protein
MSSCKGFSSDITQYLTINDEFIFAEIETSENWYKNGTFILEKYGKSFVVLQSSI